MTPERARAYGAVMRTLRILDPAKLWPSERTRVRAAADRFIFCHSMSHDHEARAAARDLAALSRALVESGRWTQAHVGWFLEDLYACGPECLTGASTEGNDVRRHPASEAPPPSGARKRRASRSGL
jgi:hypothetical protein